TVNGLSTRRVETQLEMNFGQTLMIAGLLNTRTRSSADKVPLLGDLPWIGAAFRRVFEDNSETEMLLMVTPDLVAPLDAEQVPMDFPGSSTTQPTDGELFINGQIEVPNYGASCPDCPVPGGGGYPGVMPLTPTPDSSMPVGQPYDVNSSPDGQPGVITPPPPAPGDAGQARASQGGGQARVSTRPGYLTNRSAQIPNAANVRVQQAGISNTSQLDSQIQQSGYSVPQTQTKPRTLAAPKKRMPRPGMIAP
ncbi:MAG: type and secretion system protein, partial [Planctomycetaceae bacterium]|nr:type and secretion system protein [Planctomycetaceae bacterium]